jgi:hypothetical protein
MAIGGRFRNQADLVTATLARLGVLAPGQSVDPEDTAYVTAEIDSIFRMLNDLEIVSLPDPNNIPGQWFTSLADILAGECATKFGSSPDDYAKLKKQGLGEPAGSGAAAMALKAMTRGRPTFETLRVHYF